MIVSPLGRGRRLPDRAQEFVLYAAAGGLAALGAASLVTDGRIAKILLLLSGVVLSFTLTSEKMFTAWLFCAPLVQGAGSGDHSGHLLYVLLFLAPPLLLIARLGLGEASLRGLAWVDTLPALYVGYVLLSGYLLQSEFTGGSASIRAVYTGIGISVFTYYFIAFGRTSEHFPHAVVKALLWSGIVVAVFAIIEAATGWNVWNNVLGGEEGGDVRRVLSTFSSPGALGAYLGVGIAFSIAVLGWNGPSSLKTPAILLIALSVPALYFTYTRGPVLAIAAVGTLMALVANRARWPSVLLVATVALALAVSWEAISSSAIYKERLGVTSTAEVRLAVQHASIELFRERPVFGWGYDTFDRVKLTIPTREPILDTTTSHNTFLTVLVELGLVGLVLLVLSWVVIGWRAIAQAVRGSVEPWLVAGCVGAIAAYAIGALTYDTRFFALIVVLPWIALGLARRTLLEPRAD